MRLSKVTLYLVLLTCTISLSSCLFLLLGKRNADKTEDRSIEILRSNSACFPEDFHSKDKGILLVEMGNKSYDKYLHMHFDDVKKSKKFISSVGSINKYDIDVYPYVFYFDIVEVMNESTGTTGYRKQIYILDREQGVKHQCIEENKSFFGRILKAYATVINEHY